MYDDHDWFSGYDLGDVSNHGYDYESDDLPAGCHFEDDGDNDVESGAPAPTPSNAAYGPAAASQPDAPAHAPAARPLQGLYSRYAATIHTLPNGMMDDSTECRGLVCYPVVARAEQPQDSDTPSSNSFLTEAFSPLASTLFLAATLGLVWELYHPGSTRRQYVKVCQFSRRLALLLRGGSKA